MPDDSSKSSLTRRLPNWEFVALCIDARHTAQPPDTAPAAETPSVTTPIAAAPVIVSSPEVETRPNIARLLGLTSAQIEKAKSR